MRPDSIREPAAQTGQNDKNKKKYLEFGVRRPSGVRLRGEGDGGDGSLDSEQENNVFDLDEKIQLCYLIFLSPTRFNIICMNSYLTNMCVHLSNKSRKEVSGYVVVGLYSVHEILRWCWCVCVHTSCVPVCTYLSEKHCNKHT